MFLNGEAAFFRDFLLSRFNFWVVKFFDPATVDAHQMVVMLVVIQFKNSFAGFKMMALQNAGLFKLGQNSVNGSQTDILLFRQQQAVDVFCGQMAVGSTFKQVEDLEAGACHLEANAFEVTRMTHRIPSCAALLGFGYDTGFACAAGALPQYGAVSGAHVVVPGYCKFVDGNRMFLPTSPVVRLTSFLGVMAAFGLSGCAEVPKVVHEYRIDIQQGNVVTQEMVSQLKPGLSYEQVRFILGSPVLTDVFHKDRWDYAYRLRKGSNGDVESRRFSVFFVDGKLARVAGDVVAADGEAVPAGEEVVAATGKLRTLDLGSVAPGTELPPQEDEKGFLDRMINKLKF